MNVALFEVGPVVRPGPGTLPTAPRPSVDRRPTEEEIAGLDAALPAQPRRVAVVLAGERERAGWWGPGRAATWSDAVEAARLVARRGPGHGRGGQADEHAPWHPGRCAVLRRDGTVVGHAGELHPRVVAALGLPERTCAMELDLDLLGAVTDPVPAPRLSTYPPATQDVALVVDATVPAAEVEAALRDGAGELLESVRLFDVYRGAAGRRGQGVAGLGAAVPRTRPHPHRGGDERRPGRRRGGGGPAYRRGPAHLTPPHRRPDSRHNPKIVSTAGTDTPGAQRWLQQSGVEELLELLGGSVPGEGFAGAGVEQFCDVVQVGLARASKSVLPLGKYWRSSPLVFSLLPRCQGLWGRRSRPGTPVATVKEAWPAISFPWSHVKVRRSAAGQRADGLGDRGDHRFEVRPSAGGAAARTGCCVRPG